MKKIYIGVDIAKDTFTAATALEQGETLYLGNFKNTQAGFAKLTKQVEKSNQIGNESCTIHLIAESTGGYERGVVEYAHEQKWDVSLPNATLLRNWAKGQGVRSKTDQMDAKILAKYGANQHPKPENQLSPTVQLLDDLYRRQEDIKKIVQGELNRKNLYEQRSSPPTAVLESIERAIVQGQSELDILQKEIEMLIDNDPDVKATSKRLLTVPGIGLRTVLPLLLHCYRFDARTAGEGQANGIVAYTGLDPQHHQSGRSVKARSSISRMGSSMMRSKLFMAALGGKTSPTSPLTHFYQRLVGRGKPKKVALVASARKILIWAWAIFKNKTEFDRSHHAIPKIAS